MTLNDPRYRGAPDPWAPQKMNEYSGAVDLAAQPGGTQPEDVQAHVLCEYQGPPTMLQVHVALDGYPLMVAPGDFVSWGRNGKLIWDVGFSRWESDVRSGLYAVPSTPFFRLSVKRYNRGTDPTPSTRVRGAVLPGVIGAGAEYVTSGAISLLASQTGTFRYVGAYRSLQMSLAADVGDDTQVQIDGSERLLDIDMLVPVRFPAFPRIDIPGLGGAEEVPELTMRNASSANNVSAILHVFSS